jgi:hypothetical protein
MSWRMSEPDPEAVVRSLLTERTVDIITTGRRSGEPRTTEIWTTVIDGQVLICGTPNAGRPGVVHHPRDWLANLLAAPEFILILKTSVAISLSARAEPVRDLDERKRILSSPQCEYYANKVDFDTAVAHSPVVTVTFTGDAAWLHEELAGRSTVLD